MKAVLHTDTRGNPWQVARIKQRGMLEFILLRTGYLPIIPTMQDARLIQLKIFKQNNRWRQTNLPYFDLQVTAFH